jgi:chromosome segregation ATPase
MYGITHLDNMVDAVNAAIDEAFEPVSLVKAGVSQMAGPLLPTREEWLTENTRLDQALRDEQRISDGLLGQIEGLNGRITQLLGQQSDWEARLEALQARLDRAITAHTKDIELIGEKLTEEAEERGWCDEYDELVSGLNRYLSVPLEERVNDYTVEFRVTMTITARNADAATDVASEAMQSASNRCDESMDWDHTGTEQD